MPEAIQISHLKKYYGKNRGIEDVSISIEEGDFFGFIGPNGAGKSTTIRTVLGFLQPDSGSISIFGQQAAENRKSLLAEIGYLPSEVIFYPGMKVRDLLKLCARLHGKDCTKRATELCQILELETGKKADSLSLGNRKKAGIVCALQHEPKLLILDEPTSGLDPLMQQTLFEILHELNEKGVTIVFSSHNLKEIQDHCSKAAMIKEGRIVSCGKVSDLLQKGVKKIRLKGTLQNPYLKGILDLKKENDEWSFLYRGVMKPLLSMLHQSVIEDLQMVDPSLEDVFLSYYKEGEGTV